MAVDALVGVVDGPVGLTVPPPEPDIPTEPELPPSAIDRPTTSEAPIPSYQGTVVDETV